jgi:hypothetical protein
VTTFATVPLELAYKGDRTYLQGPDMVDAVIDCLARVEPQHMHGPVKMMMHEFARNQVDLLYSIGAERCPKPENARLEFSLGNGVTGWLVETDRPVTMAQPYPEEVVLAGSKVDGKIITAEHREAFSAIEVIVSMTKRLHQTLFPTQPKWIVTRLELSNPLERRYPEGLQVELLHVLGSRLTKSVVRSGRADLGHIYFSAIQL